MSLRRRDFVTLLGSAAAAWPFAARAQQAERVRRIGFLMGSDRGPDKLAKIAAFREAIAQLGWTESLAEVVQIIRAERRGAGARPTPVAGSPNGRSLLYRRDRDVPPWTGLRTAGCHLALVRRVFERRPDVELIAFDRAAYRYWLGARTDSEDMRAAWAASRV